MIQEKLDSISTNVSTLNWYAVYTKPRAEKKLKEALEKKSIQNFLPLITEKKKWSDRQKLISVPLFASYVFVKIDYSQDSLRVLQEPQVVQFVQYNGKPATIEDDLIELIKTFLEEYPDNDFLLIQYTQVLIRNNYHERLDFPILLKFSVRQCKL